MRQNIEDADKSIETKEDGEKKLGVSSANKGDVDAELLFERAFFKRK